MAEPDQERWLPVVGHPGYEVSSHGRVRSLDRTMVLKSPRSAVPHTQRLRGRLLKPGKVRGAHLYVLLGRGNHRYIHQLVLEAFVGPRPPGCGGLHKDDDPANNHYGNLYWGTAKQNVADAIRNKPLSIRPRAYLNWRRAAAA